MRRHLSIILMTILVLMIFSACKADKSTSGDSQTKDTDNQTVVTSTTAPTPTVAAEETATVYFTKEISPESLMNIYKSLGREAKGKVAVKVHMGEPTGTNYLNPDLIKDLVVSVGGTFVDCNTAYAGRRSSTAAHLQVAEDHGFTEYADVDIMDAEGSVKLPIVGGTHLKEDMVGKDYENYDFFIILSHFKGHQMGGFGGAIKNMSIGIASVKGKCMIHTAGASSTNAWLPTNQDDFLESMAEAAKAVADDCGENIIYISIMNNMSIDCDCNGTPAAPKMEDIGILASLDPVALDKACVDLVYAAPEDQKDTLVARIEQMHGTHTLDYAEEIGLGTQNYELVNIDE
jgi:uncharacterized Fe-S center protein